MKNWEKLQWISNYSSYGVLGTEQLEDGEKIAILFPDGTEEKCVVNIEVHRHQGMGGMSESHDESYPYVEVKYKKLAVRLNLYDSKVMKSCKARRI